MNDKGIFVGEIFNIERGGSPRPIQHYLTEDTDSVPWIMIGDTTVGGKYIESTRLRIKNEGIRKSREVYPGELLLTNSMSFGRPYILKTYGCIHDGWLALKPKRNDIDLDYAYHALGSAHAMAQFQKQAAGATVKNLNKDIVASIKIPLPPLEEQRRIAAILDKAGQILSSSRQTDSLRQHLQERLFISMFGDPRSNSLGWARMSIEALTSDYVGGAALVPEDFVSQGVPVLHKGAIKPGGRIEVDSKKKGFVTLQTALHHTRNLAGPDRIAVTLRDLVPSGPFIGLMADLSTTAIPEYILAQGAYAFRVDESKVLPDYLIALVNMPAFRLVLRQNAVGSTQIHIRLPVFKSIELPVPPIDIQHKFARIISQISSIDTSGKDRIQRINELTRALQSSSFSGQPI